MKVSCTKGDEKMKIAKKLLVTLIASMLFLTSMTACTQNEAEQGGQVTQTGEEQTDLQTLSGYGSASTEDGFYYVDNLGGGAQNIRYVDYETHKDTVLCNEQDCTHDNIECPAWYKFEVAGIRIFVYNNELYVICNGGTSTVGTGSGEEEFAELGFIKKMDLNGENAQMLVTLPADHRIISRLYARGEEFFFFISKNENDETLYSLIKFDEFGLTDTEVDSWATYPGIANGTKIYFAHNLSPYEDEDPEGYVSTMRWHYYDIETGEITKSEYIFDANAGDAQLINGYFVYYDKLTHELTKTSMSTGEAEVIAQIEVDDDVGMVTFTNAFGNNIELTLHFVNKNVQVLVNVATGEVHYPQLVNVEGTEENSDIGTVYVVAETETHYLVANREQYGVVSNTYALISKEDFWNNIPNFILIDYIT
jgi:hypothetical protein